MMKTEVVINGGAMLSNNNNNNEEGEKNKMKMKKEQEEELQPYLDENIITEILIRAPVESLFNSFRYVCKSWLNIIINHPSNFPLNRLRSQPPCLIIQYFDSQTNSHEKLCKVEEDYTYTTSFIKMGKQGIEKQYDITPIFKKLRIRACCNGLILATPDHGLYMSTLYVVNPLNNHQVMLPPHPPESAGIRYFKADFIFISSAEEYWVLMKGFRYPPPISPPPKRYIQILQLSAEDCCGTSSSPPNDDCDLPHRQWKIVEVPEHLVLSMPLKYITIDVHTEKFYESSHPIYHGHQEISKDFMKMDGFLATWLFDRLYQYDDATTLSVFVLKDLHTGEWMHPYSVRIEPDFLNVWGILYPVVLNSGNGEVIIFQNLTDKALRAYNVESHRWREVGTNLKKWDDMSFYGFHVVSNETSNSSRVNVN